MAMVNSAPPTRNSSGGKHIERQALLSKAAARARDLALSDEIGAIKVEEATITPPSMPDLAQYIDDDGGLKSSYVQWLILNHTGTVQSLVTPRVAALLLETNTRNRTLRAKRVRGFAKTIEDGCWINTGEPAILSCVTENGIKTGRLSEGQHRLAAIVESGIAVEFDIRFGAPEEAFLVTGTGAVRTNADALSIVGVDLPNKVAAAARVVIWYQQGLPESASWNRLNNDEIVYAVSRWPDLINAVQLQHKTTTLSTLRNAAVAAFVFLALRQKNQAIVEAFLAQLSSGEMLPRTNPIYLVRERLLNDKELKGNRPGHLAKKLALLIKAWNMALAGEEATRLNWPTGRGGAEPFPEMMGVVLTSQPPRTASPSVDIDRLRRQSKRYKDVMTQPEAVT